MHLLSCQETINVITGLSRSTTSLIYYEGEVIYYSLHHTALSFISENTHVLHNYKLTRSDTTI